MAACTVHHSQISASVASVPVVLPVVVVVVAVVAVEVELQAWVVQARKDGEALCHGAD